MEPGFRVVRDKIQSIVALLAGFASHFYNLKKQYMKFEHFYAGIGLLKIWKISYVFLIHLKPKAYHGKTGVAKKKLGTDTTGARCRW